MSLSQSWRGRICVVAVSLSLTAIAAPLFAQSTDPPKQSAQPGPDFPKSTLPVPVASGQAATPAPGKINANNLPQPLSLDAAVAYALKLQPNIASAQATREEAEQHLKEQQANYYPNVTPTYGYEYRYTKGGSTTEFINGVPITFSNSGTQETRQGQVGATYTLFDSFNRELNNKQARQQLRSSKFSEEGERQTVILSVASNYFNSLLTAALVKVSAANVDHSQNALDVVQAQLAAGVAAQKDTYQAQADLLNAQVALLQAQNNAAIAQAQLKQSIGIVGGEPLTLSDIPAPTAQTPITALNAPAPPATTADSVTINALEELAYKTRPDVAAAEQNLESTRTSVGLARVQNGLQTSVTASDGYTLIPNHGDTSLDSTENRQLNVNLSYPLFDGGLSRAGVRSAQAAVRGAEAALDSTRQTVAVQVEQDWRTLVQARAALPAAQAAQQAAQINYDAAVESRREGVGSIVDIITAQTSLVQAQESFVQAIYQFYEADANLADAVGLGDRIANIVHVAAATAPAGAPTAGQEVAPATPTPANPVKP